MRAAEKNQVEKEKQRALGDENNQDRFNVIFRAADMLEMSGGTLLAKVCLEHFGDACSNPYTGPSVADFPELTNEQLAVQTRHTQTRTCARMS
jgi:hypothetical protein